MTADWIEIEEKLRNLHPVMRKKLDLFEGAVAKASDAAKACDPEGVGFGVDACKLCGELRSDVELLKAVGIITEETCTRFKNWLEDYGATRFREVIYEFAACLGKETEVQILSRLAQRASELDAWGQQLLVRFASEVREIEREQGSLKAGQSRD